MQIGNDDVRIDILQERMRQAMLTREDKSVFIRADGAASVQDSVDVTDKLKEAGVEKVGLHVEAGATRRIERCTKRSAMSSTDRTREADGLSAGWSWCRWSRTPCVLTRVRPDAGELADRRAEQKPTPMIISLGGALGPNAGGMTQMSGPLGAGGRAARGEAAGRAAAGGQGAGDDRCRIGREADAEAAAEARARSRLDKSASRKPTTGAGGQDRRRAGRTGAPPIPFGGLATGGGGTGGVQLDVGDFCCPEYI